MGRVYSSRKDDVVDEIMLVMTGIDLWTVKNQVPGAPNNRTEAELRQDRTDMRLGLHKMKFIALVALTERLRLLSKLGGING